MNPDANPNMPPPKEAPKNPFYEEIVKQLAPDYQALAEILVNLREKPQRSDISRALFRAKKLSAVLEEAHRQMIARGMLPAGG
jgi:hypothetical protein